MAGSGTYEEGRSFTAPAPRQPPLRTKEDVHSKGQAAQEFVGYRRCDWVPAAVAVLTCLTGGIAWAVAHCLPQAPLWTLQPCRLQQADHVLAKLVNGDKKLARIVVQRMQNSEEELRLVVVHLVVYVYDCQANTFRAVPDMPLELPQQLQLAFQALQDVAAGHDWSSFNISRQWPRQARAQLYGSNTVASGRPVLPAMAAHQLLQPLFIVQFGELAFVAYEGNWCLAAVLAAITIVASILAVWRLYTSRLALFRSVSHQRLVPVVQAGRVRALASHRLVPGDVVVVVPGKAVADLVLLTGNCLVEESLLSGEASQVRKTSIGRLSLAGYHPTTHHSYTVHSGTIVQQVWNEQDREEEVLAMVVRTGLYTSMGSMMRQILTHSKADKSVFFQDFFRFCIFAFVLHLCAFCLFIAKANRHNISAQNAFQRVVDNFIAAWPAAAPTMMIFTLGCRVGRLNFKGIATLQPGRLEVAATAEVVCFDKTGTLTSSVSDLHGMVPVVDGHFMGLQQTALRWPNPLRQAAAVCNSLTLINRSDVVGDFSERRAFKAVEAHFMERHVVSLPMPPTNGRHAHTATLTILKRFEFESSLMRSGVLAVEDRPSQGRAPGSALLIVRGAAASIEGLIGRDQLPESYRKVVDDWSGQSFRILAIAQGTVRGVGGLDLASMGLQQLEERATGLTLIGLHIISNHLHAESKQTVTQLRELGNMRLMMVTGDYHHTAIAVARGVGMIPPHEHVVIIQSMAEQKGESVGSHRPSIDRQSTAVQTPHVKRKQSLARGVSFAADLFSQAKSAESPALSLQSPAATAGRQPEPLDRPEINPTDVKRSPTDVKQSPSQSNPSPGHTRQSHSRRVLSPSRLSQSQKQLVLPPDVTLQSPGISLGLQGSSLQTLMEALQSSNRVNESSDRLSGTQKPLLMSARQSLTLLAASLSVAHDFEEFLDSQTEEGPSDGLAFSFDNGDAFEDGDVLQALSSISQGNVQCCVTGPAFACLLQQPNAALVEAVMQNSVAFTRMQSHQKSQVIELLSSTGLHQNIAGQQRHIPGLGKTCMYCGDGINDLAALAAADVGVAIGASDASAAATLSDRHCSIAGVCTVVREARALQATCVTTVKYMVLYQLLGGIATNVLFYMDTSSFTYNQTNVIDFIAISLGMVATLRSANPVLFRDFGRCCLSHPRNYIQVFQTVLVTALMYITVTHLLSHESWFKVEKGTHSQSPVVATVWCLYLVQVIMASLFFSMECAPFCLKVNKPEVFLTAAYLIYATLCCTLGPGFYDRLNYFNFCSLPWSFRYRLESCCLAGTVGYLLLRIYVRKLVLYLERDKVHSAPHS